ncbi:ELKS/Rab6-interacting/CAST family member 1 [Pundamilia nyererei]|uniref:ELKS/Rab6-interacting/CAST family member 1 n=1 Tax=Pundamilia nyererei TaxID=303518 RepID=A0A9Y3VWU7_9CICH|nr:PREDICTED: coiled-coil domain-containing protein 14 [Pundamilia nyererei]
MRGRAQRKVVTSGRLTGAARGGLASLNPGTAACPEPAYSLYSTDSEGQVISLHKGLDRCAALLGGILQADKAVSPRLHRTVSSAAAKPRLSTSTGKKSLKKGPPKAGQKSASGRHGSDSRTPRGHPSARPAPHSGVKLHPPQKPCPTQLQSHLLSPRLLPRTVSPPRHEASVLLSVRQSSSLSSHRTACRPDSETPRTACDEAQEFVPVRDTHTQSPSTHTLTHAHGDSCSMKMAHFQLEPGQAEESNTEAQTKAHKLQHLFAQLKPLIAGQGSVAESLLSHLEQTVSTAQMNNSASNIQSVSDLHRCVRNLDQQPETERHQNQAMLCNWQRLQEELTAAQSRLQELQDDLTDLRQTLQDTQSQLRDREAETALAKMELEASKSRLLDSERERSKLASLAQQRLKEMEHLHSLLSADHVVDSSVSETSQHQHRRMPAPPTDHIAQYLKSLSQIAPVQCVDAERDSDSAHLDVTAQRREDRAGTRPESDRERSAGPGEALRPEDARRQLFNSTLSQSETESVWSDLTFDTRDEAAFRDGLAALDASIASLQKTIKLDLRR